MSINVEQVKAFLALEHAGPVQEIVLNEGSIPLYHLNKLQDTLSGMGVSASQAAAVLNQALTKIGQAKISGNWVADNLKTGLVNADFINKDKRSKKHLRSKRRK